MRTINLGDKLARTTRFRPSQELDLPSGVPESAKRMEFGRRVEAAMLKKGWNQSELARRAEEHMPKGKRFGRDSISNYIKGSNFPTPINLDALCKALGMKPEDLIPGQMFLRAKDDMPPLDIRGLGDGSAWVRVNQRVSFDIAMKIMALLNEKPND